MQGLNDEIVELKVALRTLTETAIIGERNSVQDLIRRTERLNPRRKKLLAQNYVNDDIPNLVPNFIR